MTKEQIVAKFTKQLVRIEKNRSDALKRACLRIEEACDKKVNDLLSPLTDEYRDEVIGAAIGEEKARLLREAPQASLEPECQDSAAP